MLAILEFEVVARNNGDAAADGEILSQTSRLHVDLISKLIGTHSIDSISIAPTQQESPEQIICLGWSVRAACCVVCGLAKFQCTRTLR